MIGASVAGTRAIAALRLAGYQGRISVFSQDPEYPVVDRPNLSKRLLTGTMSEDAARLKVNPAWDIDVHAGVRVAAIDAERGKLSLLDGTVCEFDGAVIACGARALALPGDCSQRIEVLREHADLRRIRSQLLIGGPVAVIGAGFLGSEIAASCRELELPVTLIDQLSLPMLAAIGSEMAGLVADLHRRRGVNLQMSSGVDAVSDLGDYLELVLVDGLRVRAAAVVAAIGVRPATEWLDSSLLTEDKAVACDRHGFVAGLPNVVAAGDVARWECAGGTARGSEHWTSAGNQGQVAGTNLALRLVGSEKFIEDRSVPYFWTDQYDWAIQMVGTTGPELHLIKAPAESEGVAHIFAHWYDGSELVGAFGVNEPGAIAKIKREMSRSPSLR